MSDLSKLRDCDTCSKPFVADEDWKRVCVVCWKEQKGYKLAIGDKAFKELQDLIIAFQVQEGEMGKSLHAANLEQEDLEEKLKGARRTVRRLRKELRELQEEGASRPQARPQAPPLLTSEQVMGLLKLCHPDKHGNSELATRMTQWLLDQKRSRK